MSEWIDAGELYPLKFSPIYQERIWGGTLMNEYLGRQTPDTGKPVGESWELVDRPEAMSVVAEGSLAGKTFHDVLTHYSTMLTGPKVAPGTRFPIMVKLIDAGDRLSLQVHPDDAACARIGGGAEPKTEMWYIVAARKNGRILAGLTQRATQLQLRDRLNSPDVDQLLQIYPSQPGDAYFIPSGTLHAIDAGNLILEIQQNSDTTYRISDWGRVDANGKSRELHVEKGLAAIDFMNRTSPRIAGVADQAAYNRKFSIVGLCRFFKVDDLRLATTWHDDTTGSGSCHLLSAVAGAVEIRRENRFSVMLNQGETALVPFCCGEYELIPQDAGETVVVKTTL